MANDAIRRIRQVFSVEGAEAVVAANQRVASSQDAIARTSSSTERASLSLDRQFSSLERRYVSTVRAQQDYERVQRQVNAAVAQNPALTERASIVLEEASRRYHAQVTASKGLVTANDNITRATGLARHEMVNLSRQMQDVFITMQAGQPVSTILIQQGTQIADIFATSRVSLRGFATQIATMITPMRLLALGTAALGVAAYVAYSSWKSFALQIDDTAKIAGTTTREMAQLQAAASFKGIGQDDFSGGVKSFSAALYEARSGAGDLYKLLRDNKIAAGDFSKTFEDVLNLVARARGNTGLQFSLLQQAGLPATLEWVRLAEDIQKPKSAAVEFGGAANDNMVRKAREVDEAWNRFWTNFSFGAKQATVEAVRGLSELGGEGSAYRQVVDYLSERLYTSPARYGSPPRTRLTVNPRPTEQFGPPIPGPAPVDPRAEENRRRLASEALQMEQQRLQLLGDLATADEKVRLVEIGIAQARLQPRNKITDDDVRRIMDYARATEQLNRNQERLSYLGGAATDAEKYALAQERLNLALQKGDISQNDFNRALIAAHPLFDPLKSAATDFATTITTGFASGAKGIDVLRDALNNLEQQLIRLATQKLFEQIFGLATGTGPTGGGLLSLLFGNQHGNAFHGGNVIPFARGGVVNRPTIFPMARGMGLMGEAGPEAVMPLRRGPDGRLGVESRGGNASITIAPTIQVTTNGGTSAAEGEKLAQTISNVVNAQVRDTLIREKRAGGLLS